MAADPLNIETGSRNYGDWSTGVRGLYPQGLFDFNSENLELLILQRAIQDALNADNASDAADILEPVVGDISKEQIEDALTAEGGAFEGDLSVIDPDLIDGDVDFSPETSEPVWPEPGSRHPETGETQEEISARWKREEAAKAKPLPKDAPEEKPLPEEPLPEDAAPKDAPPLGEDPPPSEEAPPADAPLEELPPLGSVAEDYLSSVQNSFAEMSQEDQAGIFKSTSSGTPIEQAIYDQLLNNVFAKGGVGFEIAPDKTSLLFKIPAGIPSIGGPMRIKILNEDGSLVPLPDVLGEAKNKVAQAGKDILAIPGQILDEAKGALGDLKDLGGVVAGTSNKTLTEVLGEIFSGVLVEGSDTLPKTGWMGQGILGDIYDIFLKEVDDWKSGGDPSKFGGDPFPVAPDDDGLPPAPPSDTPPPESPFGEKPPEADSEPPEVVVEPPKVEPPVEPPVVEPPVVVDPPAVDPPVNPPPGPEKPKDPVVKPDDPKDDDPKDDNSKDDDSKDDEKPVIIESTPPPETLFGDGGETVDDPPEESGGGGGGGGGAGGMFEPYSGSINYGLPQFQAVPYNLKKDYNASLDRIMQESLFGNFN